MKRRGKRERKREKKQLVGGKKFRRRRFLLLSKKILHPAITDDHITSSFLAFLFLRFALRRRWGRRFEIVKYFHPVDVISIR
jgi:hypothetical protein